MTDIEQELELGPTAAKLRKRVLVTRPDSLPFTATLIHWPLDPDKRRPKDKTSVQASAGCGTVSSRRRRAGAKAKVQLSSGAIVSVAPEHVQLV